VVLVCDRRDGDFIYPDSFTARSSDWPAGPACIPTPACTTCATPSLWSSGDEACTPVIVPAVLGHASPAFTIAVYQHAWQEGPSETARALECPIPEL
jgi:hypothetical protein